MISEFHVESVRSLKESRMREVIIEGQQGVVHVITIKTEAKDIDRQGIAANVF